MKNWVFWLNITENHVYLWYGYCSKLFGNLRKESEFWQRCCQNSNKSMREKKWVMWWEEGEKIWISVISLPKCLLPYTLPARWSAQSAKWNARKGNQLWQPSCQNCRGVRREKNRRKKKKELWQPSCWKLREKFNSNLGNEVAENEGKKKKI